MVYDEMVEQEEMLDAEWEEHTRRHEDGEGGNGRIRRTAHTKEEGTAGLDAVKYYLKDIRSIPLLTFPEEQALAKRVATGDEEARSRMIESNLRLVIAIGKRYINRGLTFSDIIEEGNLGLIRAVEKFDYRRGFKFSTYASWWIKQAIERAIANQSRIIRLPIHVVESVNAYNRTVRKLTRELGREPQAREIARAMRTTIERVRSISQVVRETLSLDMFIGSKEEDTLKDLIEDTEAPSPLRQWDDHRRRLRLEKWLTGLTNGERNVITLRFGLNGEDPQTLDGIGKQLGITRERVRQIENVALEKLRHMVKAGALTAEEMLA